MTQRYEDVDKRLYLCFIDYSKAFDYVYHKKLTKILMKIGISDKEQRILAHLYCNLSREMKKKN